MKLHCLPILNVGMSGDSDIVPAQSKALFIIDFATIDGNTVTDVKNGKIFTITDKDFTAQYFPYKTAATIAAPVGDAELFAADVNSFLYGVDANSPNQIPVVSLYQNIDYEDKIFSLHVAQTVDSNGVETIEPHVKYFVGYSAALTGADLTAANTFYGVPTETAGAVYVTGDYATNTLAIAAVSPGDTIYNKSLTITEPSLPTVNKAIELFGLGRSVVGYTGTPTNLMSISATAAHLKRLIFNGDNAITIGLRISGADNTIEKCFITDIKTGASMIQELNVGITLKDCVFKGRTDQTSFYAYGGADSVIDGCFISGTFSNNVIGLGLVSTEEGTVQYCRFVIGRPVTYFEVSAASIYNFLHNELEITDRWVNEFGMQTADCILNIKYNTINFIGTSQNANGALIFTTFPVTGTLNLENNRIDSVDGIGRVLDKKMKIVNVKSNYARFLACLVQGEVTESANYENNTLVSWGDTNGGGFTGIVVSSAVGELDLDVVIQKNKILNGRYFNPAYGGAHGCIYIRDYINATIKYNYDSGAGVSSIIYKSTVAMDSTTGVIMYNLCTLSGIWNAIGATKIYNNTVINAVDQGLKLIAADDVSEISGCEVKNNIIINEGSDLLVDVQTEKVADAHTIDYNIYYSIEAKPFKHKGTTKTWAEWKALGYDANSIFLTAGQFAALFTNFTSGDYSLVAGSQAIGTGETLTAAYDDGLDASTDWGDDDELSTVVTKQQTASWDCGAYVS